MLSDFEYRYKHDEHGTGCLKILHIYFAIEMISEDNSGL